MFEMEKVARGEWEREVIAGGTLKGRKVARGIDGGHEGSETGSGGWSMAGNEPGYEHPIAATMKHLFAVAEAEVRHAVARVDAEVVPQVRRESAAALRELASQLEKLGRKLDGEGTPPR